MGLLPTGQPHLYFVFTGIKEVQRLALCRYCEGGVAHRDQVLAARCQLLQGIQRREVAAGGDSSVKSKKKKSRKKRVVCQSLGNDTRVDFFCPSNLGTQKDDNQEHSQALMRDVNCSLEKGLSNEFKEVLDILRNMTKGAWIKWVEKQYNKKVGGYLQNNWVLQMEEKGLVRKEEPGIIFSLMTEENYFLDTNEMECEDIFFSCDSVISQDHEDEKRPKGRRGKPEWLTLLMKQRFK